jgi:hypothetical protein
MLRRSLLLLLLVLAVLPGCMRKRAAATVSSTAKTDPSFARSTSTPGKTEPSFGRLTSTPGNNQSPPPSQTPSSMPVTVKGHMTLNVEGTNLEFPLDAFTIQGDSFQLAGQGMKLTGSLGGNWSNNPEKLAGQSLTVSQRDPFFGNSEFDLPGTGIAPVVSGTILIERVSVGPRLQGKITFTLQGPFGNRPFEGTFNVGVVKK